jgi:hypothetical protein
MYVKVFQTVFEVVKEGRIFQLGIKTTFEEYNFLASPERRSFLGYIRPSLTNDSGSRVKFDTKVINLTLK